MSCMCSDHSKFTAGGSISNHAFGRGLDIASIDGEIVSPGSALARDVASELSELPAAIRPDEIGSPFAISGPGYFTDAAHQNHVHVGFKQEITPDFKLPPDLVAGAPQAAPVAAAVAPAAPERRGAGGRGAGRRAAQAAPASDPKKASGLFAAVAQPGKVAGVGGAPAAGAPKASSDSNLFLQAVRAKEDPAPAAPAAAAAAADPAAPAVDLAGVSDAYPGDDAPKAELAAWMAKEAEKRGLPPQLPVMASLVESGLQNLNFGDADSVGFFQMRVSIHNNGDYAGYPDDPKKQIDWFLDNAEQVKAQRIAAGKPIDDPSQFGEWIADVERPAEQYRGRYQLRLEEANGLLAKAAARRARGRREAAAPPAAAAPPPPEAPAARKPIDPDQFGQEGTGGTPDAEAQALLKNKNIVLDDVGVADIKAGRIDPRIVAVRHQAQPGAQDRRLLHVQRPLPPDRRWVGLQPHVRPRPGHRLDRRRDRQPGQRARARRGVGAVAVRSPHPPGRDRVAVRDQRSGLLHRRGAPEPHPRRVQAGDRAGLQGPA